mgnify:CR=1 FL=1
MSPTWFKGAILRGESINVFNEGKMQCDFTYIDYIVEGVVSVIDKMAKPDASFDKKSGSSNLICTIPSL